jgi:hypothetical protein
VGGEFWAGVEWSEKRQAWCIEDAEGGCLRHEASIHGQAHSKRAAVALAREMIRDGRIPSPEEAWRKARRGIAERRDKRRQQPAQIRKREERQRLDAACAETGRAEWNARWADTVEMPLLEALAEAFNFTDPDLWKSNSWAGLWPGCASISAPLSPGLKAPWQPRSGTPRLKFSVCTPQPHSGGNVAQAPAGWQRCCPRDRGEAGPGAGSPARARRGPEQRRSQ